jgi:hypothetical protein
MANPVHNTDYLDDGLNKLLGVFQGKPRIASLLKSWLLEAQAVEDAFWDIWFNRLLANNTATGDLLRILGALVGQGSEGQTDANFRLLITARIRANRSDGLREDLITITSLLVPSTTIFVKDYPPGALMIIPLGPVSFSPYLIYSSFLKPAVLAGVRLMFGWTTAPIASTLIWGYSPGGITQPTTAQSPGWSGNGGAPINGGEFGGIISS